MGAYLKVGAYLSESSSRLRAYPRGAYLKEGNTFKIKDRIQLRACEINKESVGHFSQFISVKFKKIQ